MISESAKLGGRREHPWLDEFAANPRDETARLLAGLANIGSFSRADPSDAATLLFDALSQDDPRRAMLGNALVAWLNEKRGMGLRERAGYGLDPFVREVSDAFRIIWRLGLTEAAGQLRKDFEEWDSWARPLMLTPARDARRAFLRLCALMQVPLDDSQLESVWLSLCKAAGRELFPAYLDVGLLGLRRMPGKEFGFDPAAKTILGLAVWAKSLRPSRAEFLKEWRALKSLYVRTPANFVEIVNGALELAEKGGREPFQASEWWRNDLKINERKIKKHVRSGEDVAPSKERADEIVRQLKRFGITEDTLGKIESIMREHERYATRNSDSFFLVRGAGVLAAGLLRLGDKRAIAIALGIVRRALGWDINDAHKWSLWQQALSLSGDRRNAECIGWEAIRRFPEDPALRVQLSRFLAADPTRQAEAWSLITETVNRFPKNEHSWTQLALIMKNMPGRKWDIEKLLEDALKRLPDNLIIRSLHASALLNVGKTKEAGHELDVIERNTDGRFGAAYYTIRTNWAFQTGGADLAKTYLIEALENYPEDVEFRAKLAALEETGTIEEEDYVPASVTADIRVTDADLFETADITEISDDQPAPPENSVVAPIVKNAVVAPLEKVESSEVTGNHDVPAQHDFPVQDAPVQGPQIARIEEAASERIAELPRAAEPPRTAETQQAESPKNVESERVKPAPEEQKQIRLWAAPLIDVKFDPVYIEAIRYGRAKRIDYALNGAGLDEPGKRAARNDLKQLLSENETFGYGHLVNLRRVNPEIDDQLLQGLGREDAIFLQQAWQAEDAEKLNDLAIEGREILLVQCATALLGDKEAREQFARSITSHPGREGRGSRALRLVLSTPLKRELESDAAAVPKTLFEGVEDLIVNDPDMVAQALTEAIDASFDYFATEQWVNSQQSV